MTFRKARLEELPCFLDGTEGRAYAIVLGDRQDTEVRLLIDGMLMRFPARCPADALDLLGATFETRRAPSPEALDDPAYTARIAAAWDTWESAPTMGGVRDIFAPYGGVPANGNVVVFSNSDAAFDGNAAAFTRVFVITGSGVFNGIDGDWMDPGTWGDGGLWDFYFDPAGPTGLGVADYDWIKRELRLRKGAHAYPVFVAVGQGQEADGGPFWDSPNVIPPGGPAHWDTVITSWDATAYPHAFLPIGRTWDDQTEFYGLGSAAWDTPGLTWDGFVPPSGGW